MPLVAKKLFMEQVMNKSEESWNAFSPDICQVSEDIWSSALAQNRFYST